MTENNIILASESPTRCQLLKQLGLDFSTVPARIDERQLEQNSQLTDQPALTNMLAIAKATQVSARFPHAYIIGADQTLCFNQQFLHKPENFDQLRQQLNSLRGQTHNLCTSVTIIKAGNILWQHHALAYLTMHDFTDAERDKIIALEGQDLLQSVGGYRLEGPSIRLFSNIVGDYFTILGLPLLPLVKALRDLKVI